MVKDTVPACRGNPDLLVTMAEQDQLERRDLVEILAALEHLVYLDPLDHEEREVFKDKLVMMDDLDLMDNGEQVVSVHTHSTYILHAC